MSVLMLHLSDLHIKGEDDKILKKHKLISSVLIPHLPTASAVFIVISGDIAQSGKKIEYERALRLFRDLVNDIKAEKSIPVEVIVAPGNHDCDFSGDLAVRNSVLKDIPSHVGNIPSSLIIEATRIQANYFEFRERLISNDSLIFNDPLWSIQSFSIEGKQIWFDSLNTSWMSTIKEQQGGLLFPFEIFKDDFKPSDADLRISVLHHPLNWFNQANYHEFRTFIQSLEDIIITGHEHEGNAGVRDEARSGQCAFIEGGVLQTAHNSEMSEFNLIILNLESQQMSCEHFSLQEDTYCGTGAEGWLPIRNLPERVGLDFELTNEFSKTLTDPGATYRHPDKKNLRLDDFYVFPDLDLPTSERGKKTQISPLGKKKNSSTLTRVDALETDILLEGDENAGKTSLLYKLFSSYYAQDYLPLYLDARHVKSSTPAELRKLFSSTIEKQYGKKNVVAFEQASSQKKILLLDNYDNLPLNPEHKKRFQAYIATGFRARVMTVGENFEILEFVATEDSLWIANCTHYRILPFGYERRGELVKKWNTLGSSEVLTDDQWLQACYQAEKLIETARLQHIATTVPILVLSLLQANSSGVFKEQHNSSFAHYFYFLIIGALENADVPESRFAIYLAFGTHLSWFIKQHGISHEITESQFFKFCKEYSTEWTLTNPSEMSATLIQARILDKHGDTYSFTYLYAYYYFLGRYTSAFIHKPEVKEYLQYCMENLYARECANTLLFLAHHSDNSYVIDGVTKTLSEHFHGVLPVTFSKTDVKTISALIANAPDLVYLNKIPAEKRIEGHKYQDENDNGHDGLLDEPRQTGEERGFIEEFISFTKTAEIAGVLLTNQFASLTRAKKNASIQLVFDTSLKAIRVFYELFENDQEQLLRLLATKLQSKNRELTPAEAEIQVRNAIAWILRIISTSFIIKAGTHLTSPDLRDNVRDVVGSNPTQALRLVEVSQILEGPGSLPRAALLAIIKEEKDNPCVMSVLQLLILKRLYMYDTVHEDKHWAIATFRLSAKGNVIASKAGRSQDQRKF